MFWRSCRVWLSDGSSAKLGAQVCALERHEILVKKARSHLGHLGCRNVDLRHGDGTQGWPEGGPFDVILASVAARHAPPILKQQLKPAGRLIIPLGDPDNWQRLCKLTRLNDESFSEEEIKPVRFVPLVPE